MTSEEDKKVIDHPARYNGNSPYECIKVLNNWMTPEEYKGFLRGNCLKYLCRVGKKDAEVQELKKASWYLNKLIESYKGVNMVVRFKKLVEDAVIPSKAHPEDAGFDLCTVESGDIPPHGFKIFKTGIAWQSEDKWCYMQLQGRSGLCYKHGIECCNAGVIDSLYTGEIAVKLHNTTDAIYQVKKGDKIAQGIILTLPKVEVIEVNSLDETSRGDSGFGASGR